MGIEPGAEMFGWHEPEPGKKAGFFPNTRRTQLNSSLIESCLSNTEQTQAQSGSEANKN